MGIFVGKQKIDKKSLILQERYWRRNNFGMELRDAIGYCNENGEYTKDTHRFNLDFNGLKEIPENGFYYQFYYNDKLDNVSFPDLITVNKRGLVSAFEYSSIQSITFDSLEKIEGTTTNNDFRYNLSSMCKNCKSLKYAYFPSLKFISAQQALSNTFENSTLEEAYFPNLEELVSYVWGSFDSTFYKCKNLKIASFPKLWRVRRSAFDGAFEECTSLEEISFPSLTTVEDQSNFYTAFKKCSSLKKVEFPLLENFVAFTFMYAFQNCTALTRIDFPSVKSTSSKNVFGNASSSYAFTGCSALTEIHFRADAQEWVSTLNGYADKWGATNATIYFDL